VRVPELRQLLNGVSVRQFLRSHTFFHRW
jgi:hypothetical protein